jgi:hypothetical protein
MERWLQQLQEADSPGCHLLTLVENTRALKFFEKSGFRNHGNPNPGWGDAGQEGGTAAPADHGVEPVIGSSRRRRRGRPATA